MVKSLAVLAALVVLPGLALAKPPRDLTEKAYMATWSDDDLLTIVRKGGAAVGKSPMMPPWSPALKDDDIQDVVAFVRTLGQ